ncbi:hypothetical protein [Almyronema epifaneia]|uniref:DUF4148 domain-containing protein n=1 Tax=Almyronema epifaneia S1 TaxID=2991925 RepID=A0ABW6ID04_9CYAN
MSRFRSYLALALTGGLTSLGMAALAPKAVAQDIETTVDPLEDFRTRDDGNDPFSDSSLSPLDIIHRINLSGDLNTAEYRQRQQESISSEALNFRQQQLEALGEQPLRLQFEPTPAAAPSEP